MADSAPTSTLEPLTDDGGDVALNKNIDAKAVTAGYAPEHVAASNESTSNASEKVDNNESDWSELAGCAELEDSQLADGFAGMN